MSPLRRLLVPLAAATAALACAPVASATIIPKAPQYLEFWVSAKGTQTTTWSRAPISGGDCYSRWSEQPTGKETVTFRAKKQKALATVIGKHVIFRYGSWDLSDPAYEPLKAKGSTSRSYKPNRVDGPGPCGAKSEAPTPPTYDCGTRNRTFLLNLAYTKQHVGLDASSTGKPFETCPLTAPALVDPDAVTAAWQSWPVDDVKGEFDKQIILADEQFRLDDGTYKAHTDVKWQLTLTRHGRKH